MITYKQILNDLSGIAYYHQQIRSFGFGDLSQITTDKDTLVNPKWPKLYVVPQQVLLEKNAVVYNFSLIVCDSLEEDLSNQADVLNDTLEITKDIFTILWHSYTTEFGGFTVDYEPRWNSSVQPFLERFDCVLAGWTMNLTIEQPYPYNRCDIPIPPFIGEKKKWFELAELWQDESLLWKDI